MTRVFKVNPRHLNRDEFLTPFDRIFDQLMDKSFPTFNIFFNTSLDSIFATIPATGPNIPSASQFKISIKLIKVKMN